jgi:hypothetical protein
MPSFREVFKQPYHLIVEGRDDAEFYTRVLREARLTDFQVGCPRNGEGVCMGKDKFRDRMEVILRLAAAEPKGFVVLADGDDDPEGRLRDAMRSIEDAKLPRPQKAFDVTPGKNPVTGSPVKTGIIMVPGDGIEGGLESLLLTCCDGLAEYRTCVDNFCTCVQRPGRRKIDEDKVRLRAIIAATHRDDPGIALSYWVAGDHCPFPMNHPALQFITDFLRTFAA